MEWFLSLKVKHVVSIVVTTTLILTLAFTLILYLSEDVIDDDTPQSTIRWVSEEVVQSGESSGGGADTSMFDEYQEISVAEVERRYRQLDDDNYHDFEVDRVVEPITKALQHAESTKIPFIVWWPPFSHDKGIIKRCWTGDCFFTNNRSFYNHTLTKAILFYGTDFNISDLPLPRKAHHEWGLFHEESPKNEAMYLYEDAIEIFNHTATFREESGYPITTQYIISASQLLKPVTYTLEEKNEIRKVENLSSVVYIQSGCNPPSDRDAYINELQKYIAIDCYGKCLHNKDLPKKYVDPLTMFEKGFMEILEKYKFIISFENGICKDYLTEKLYRTLHLGAIPIYKGAPNVRDWLPTNNYSAIVVDDFETPKQLADYIKYVDETPEEYEKYLEYKESGLTNNKLKDRLKERQWGVDTVHKMSYVVGFECHVCDQIHKNKNLVVAGRQPIEHKATFDHYGCPVPQKYDLPSPPGVEDYHRESWHWEYVDAARRVKKLKKSLGLD